MPNAHLHRFSSSLEEDLVLAPFDVQCSLAHVDAIAGSILSRDEAALLRRALLTVRAELASGEFVERARRDGAEDVDIAIDARVRELTGHVGERLHSGRSRNDRVATTLLLYVRDRATRFHGLASGLAISFTQRAREEIECGTVLAATTHGQPAQPVLLAFMLVAWAEPFVRSAHRFSCVARDAKASCPLGSAAMAGSTLPLDRDRSAKVLGFDMPSRNALYSVSNRDGVLDLAHACVRAVIDASRIAEELVTWCTPGYGYVRSRDPASTSSSVMLKKCNPDPFELVRAHAATLVGRYAGALATLCGLAPSYHRDLQRTKAETVAIAEEALSVLEAFARACEAIAFDGDAMWAKAGEGYTVATDIAEALIASGTTARVAHALVGPTIARAHAQGRALNAGDLVRLSNDAGLETLDAPLEPVASIAAKRTSGSTSFVEVRLQIRSIEAELATLLGGAL